MRNPDFCICENKDADQLQRLYFRYADSIIPLLPKSKISSPEPSSVIVQPGLCRTWSETPKTGFLTSRLKSCHSWSMFFGVFSPLKNYVNTPIQFTMKMTIQMKKDMFFFFIYFAVTHVVGSR